MKLKLPAILPTPGMAAEAAEAARKLPRELEQHMIDTVAAKLAELRPMIEKEWDPKYVLQLILNGLRSMRPEFAIMAIQDANAGDDFADEALKIVFVEMVDGAYPGWGPWHVHIKNYGIRVVDPNALRKRPRGRRWINNWLRNFHICGYVIWTCNKFGLHPMRNQVGRRAGRAPSGISVVVGALARAKILHISEARVQDIWKGLPGEIAGEIFARPAC